MSDAVLGLPLLARPENLAAEQALLGAILANNKALDRVGSLRPEHFSDPVNGRVYEAIQRRVAAGQLADAITLKTDLASVLEPVGGNAYLAQLLAAMVGIINAGEYASAIVECWKRRQLIDLSQMVIDRAIASDDPDREILAFQDALSLLQDQEAKRRGPVMLSEAIQSVFERADAMQRGLVARPLSTGIAAIDRALGGGLAPATLTYLLGLGAMGKTELASQVAESVAAEAMQRWVSNGEQGPCPGVLYISLGDMTAEQIAARSAARIGKVRLRKIRHGELDDEVQAALINAERVSLTIPLVLNDSIPATLASVLGEIRRFVKRRPAALVVIDNLSNLISGNKSKEGLFFATISTTAELKRAATLHGIPIWLLMHMNQSVATRDNPTPKKGDVPWGTEKDCDSALGMWRPIMRLSKSPPEQGAMKEEAWLRKKDEWHKARDALRGVTEIVPLKIREDDGSGAEMVRLTFDHDTHQFYSQGETEDAGS